MRKALVPALVVLLVVIAGLVGWILNSGPLTDAPAQGEGDACAVAENANGVKWQQQSAEAHALQGQTYDLAGRVLAEAVAAVPQDGRPAIITDLDETAIDNTALFARDIAHCHDYSTWDTWDDWEKHGSPTLIPGAQEFFDRADELGVEIFYLSDRTEANLDATVTTLEGIGLPQVDEDHVRLLGAPKAERRAEVVADHTVLMQLGDTLHDFDGAFADAPPAEQERLIAEHEEKFGTEWFILPNPTYGDWSEANLDAWDAPLVTEDQ